MRTSGTRIAELSPFNKDTWEKEPNNAGTNNQNSNNNNSSSKHFDSLDKSDNTIAI